MDIYPNYMISSFVVNAPCQIKWAQTLTLDNLTSNRIFLNETQNYMADGFFTNIALGSTPPYRFALKPTLSYEDGNTLYIVLKVKALDTPQRDLKLQALSFNLLT
jgi:hypothetical protein